MDDIALWRSALAAARLCLGKSFLDLTPVVSGTSSRLRWTVSTRAPLSLSPLPTPLSTTATTLSVLRVGELTTPTLLPWFTRAESTPSPRETTLDPLPPTVSVAFMSTMTAFRSKLGRCVFYPHFFSSSFWDFLVLHKRHFNKTKSLNCVINIAQCMRGHSSNEKKQRCQRDHSN